MKKILCINYSQSGQLDEILNNFIAPLQNVELDRVKIMPEKSYPFPWKTNNFYDPMPETVLEEPIILKPIEFNEQRYDLIILGYQPWFLSPSLPSSSLLKNEAFKVRLKDTPVITVIGARNMWLNAQTSVVKLVQAAGGRMVGNFALVDRAPNLLSAISIVHWMMTGKKTRKWGIFPIPGVSEEDIKGSAEFGELLNKALGESDFKNLQPAIVQKGGLRISTSILFIEEKAKKIFLIWANLIKKKEAHGKNRSFWIAFFRVYLNVALFGVAPLLLTFYTFLLRPLTQNSIKRKKNHYTYLGIDKEV